MTKAEDVAFKEWLETLPEEFLACRDVRHAWGGENRFWSLQTSKYGLVRGRVLVCARCGAMKHQVMHQGIIIKSSMSYPSDYTKPAHATPGRVNSAEFRERLSLFTPIDSKAAPLPALAKMLERLKAK